MPVVSLLYSRRCALAAVSALLALNGIAKDAERWGIVEIALPGPVSGNPFLEVRIGAHFHFAHRTVDV
ncbi:MAG TPA: hypothetical protein VHW24_19590, partial [Bryobacteraceae bacterium]|nr:hypothetical protein [Bryobacteraceae bacterium]